MMTQPRLDDCMRSRVALKDFSTALGFVFTKEPEKDASEDKNRALRALLPPESSRSKRQRYFEKLATASASVL